MKMTKKLKTPGQFGFTLIEIMVVVAIIGRLMSVATPGINQAVKRAKQQTRMLNLDAIDHVKQMWVLVSRKGDNEVATEDELKVFLKNNTFPTCPSGGTYCQGRRIGDSGVRPSPGAATPDGTETYWFSKAFWHSLVAAPEDGRTPAWSCIPASHQYAINSINSPPSCPAHGSLTPTGPSPGGN